MLSSALTAFREMREQLTSSVFGEFMVKNPKQFHKKAISTHYFNPALVPSNFYLLKSNFQQQLVLKIVQSRLIHTCQCFTDKYTHAIGLENCFSVYLTKMIMP